MDYVVTCRLHGVIFAHLLNKPVLTIAHHPKVTELMAALGLSETAWRNFNTSELAGGKVHVDGEQRRGNQESDDRDLDVKQAVAEISI
jgi:polysaccharide pyruvyl transferase WcaK-like protein